MKNTSIVNPSADRVSKLEKVVLGTMLVIVFLGVAITFYQAI